MNVFKRGISLLLILLLLVCCLPAANAASSYSGTINNKNVYFRTAPSKNSNYYTFLQKGDKLTVSGISGDFFQVQVGRRTGYVMCTFVTLSSSAWKALTKAASATTVISDYYMRGITRISQITVPSASKKGDSGAKVLALQQALKIKKLYTAPITQKYDSKTVAAVKAFQLTAGLAQSGTADNTTIKALFGKTAGGATPAPTGSTSSSAGTAKVNTASGGLNLRASASSDARRLLVIPQNAKVNVISKGSTWSKVTYGGQTGYVMTKFLKFSSSATPTPTSSSSGTKAWVNTASGGLNFRPGPSASGLLMVIPRHATVKVLSKGSTWTKISYGGKTGYVMTRFLSFTGSAPGNPTPAPSNSKTEKLKWFNTGKNLFRIGDTIQIKDVHTGKTWKARVLYGSNHLDAEPLTSSDTSKMKAAYGGAFNYVRRPVLVKYNGHIYGGSLYGEPHGEQTILNNNYKGQFCIHFTGSKTHGTAVVDPAHQAAVNTALNATW